MITLNLQNAITSSNHLRPALLNPLFHKQFLTPEMMKACTANLLLACVSTPDDTGDVITFLASDAVSYLARESIELNGGMLML